MSIGIDDAKIREALATVGQYLSDAIPPLQATDSVLRLLEQPAELMASEIIGWVPSQFQGSGPNVSMADYLFHAVSKLHYLAQLQLISEQALAPYLDSVKQLMLEHCPSEDRPMLEQSFARLGTAEATMVTPISLIHRQMKTGESNSISQEPPKNRRLSILQDRLRREARGGALPAGNKGGEDPVPHLIATAAANIQSEGEFCRLQENLKSLGIESGTDQIFRKLSQSLPGWLIATTGSGNPKSHNAAIEAMGQIIHLAEGRWEGSKRFQDMVQAAIEQFNAGSLARAATIFDLALGLCSDARLDPAAIAGVRATAHESLDMNRLRSFSKERDRHHLLRKVLNFFDAFTAKRLLEDLRTEEKRERRRLLLDLLEIHGDSARKMAFERLRDLLAETNIAADWHFARNLVCILERIPRAADASLKAEIDLIAPILRLSLPAPLVKEAIKFAGQTRCADSEELLIATTDKLVRFAVENSGSDKNAVIQTSLLDRAIFALAHYGTPKAHGRVVKHGIHPLEGLGDTAARLPYLSSQDLTSDMESVSSLIQFLKSKLPRKLFGMTIQKNEMPILHTIKALSSTPAPIVRQTFQEIAAQFPETQFGQAAAGALREFASSDRSQISADRSLTGDLELFGLPDLLQQLHQLQASGTLTLKDAKGNLAGTVTLLAGRMHSCSAGRLEGKEAAYQLLECPIGGTFFFQGQKESGLRDQADQDTMPDLTAILNEGLRRYDHLQRARAVVPDFALLRVKEAGSVPSAAEEEAELASPIWQKLHSGASPEECEAACVADSYRVRSMLARWTEEGLLVVA